MRFVIKISFNKLWQYFTFIKKNLHFQDRSGYNQVYVTPEKLILVHSIYLCVLNIYPLEPNNKYIFLQK